MLSGNNPGQVFQLINGRNLVGRGENCQIRFNDMNVSKEHALILIENDKITLIDNQSRNGTYLNGALINKSNLKKGDKLSFNQILCDVIQFPNTLDKKTLSIVSQNNMNVSGYIKPNTENSLNPYQQRTDVSMNHPFINNDSKQNSDNQQRSAVGLQNNKQTSFFKRYFEEVLMPGVYQLGQVMEYKLVIGLFMIIFAVLVTGLSTIPMLAITSDSIQLESRRRALTIARNLANVNQQALLKEMESALSTQTADLEEGVSQALIIRQSDGTVIAPATKAGTIPSVPFIEVARREQKEVIQQVDSSHIAVAVPLAAFNPETASYNVKAIAIVVYDMGSLAVNDGRTLSLFFQTLLIAFTLGFILYYLFYRFVEYPIADLNRQLDLILKNKAEPSTSNELDFPIFQTLLSNVNTLLTRLGSPENQENNNGVNKDLEATNFLRLIGYAGIAISSEYNIIGLNQTAEQLLGMQEGQLRNQPLTLIPDQALQKSLYDLMEHASRDPAVISKNELEFGGENTEISCQALTERGKINYYIVTIIPLGGVS